ncbi:hypothetical protein M093_0780 [Bacteroides uniformis str. 3978 T3 i]|nr:hypothetical protein M093_3715 [Bacteroides uniformis str. 3978 T3 i]KDS61074.1 hypothetical protein M093_0780 [Bacteroides uniformis str. 3978 T3 i]
MKQCSFGRLWVIYGLDRVKNESLIFISREYNYDKSLNRSNQPQNKGRNHFGN